MGIGSAAALCAALFCTPALAQSAGDTPQWMAQPVTLESVATSYQNAASGCEAAPASCQEDPALDDGDYWAGFYKVPYEMVKRPFDFSERALIIDAIAIGGFGLFYLADEDIRDEVGKDPDEDVKDVFDTFEPLGDLYTVLAITGGSYLVGEATNSYSLQRVGLNGTQAVALAALPVGATKYLFGRKRPNKNDGNGEWFDGGNSFLSGHTTYAFTLASVVSHEYQDENAWVPWVAYGTAAMVGGQRMVFDKHWASDVFLSALVGWGIGQAVSDMDYFTSDMPLEMQSMTTPGVHGVELSYKF